MRVLITNDDGVDSPGLQAAADRLSREHEVWVVAPDSERSGTSHSITLHEAVRIREVSVRVFACSGTPADCVLFSFLGAVPERPEIVVSGINLGPNLGTDIIYSGTVAAARQGALMGCPAVAISVDGKYPPFRFRGPAEFLARNLDIIASQWHDDHFLNINFPNQDRKQYGVVVTHPSRRIYRDKAVRFVAPNKDMYYFLDGSPVESEAGDGSDSSVVSDGNVSVSPVFLHPVNYIDRTSYERVVFR